MWTTLLKHSGITHVHKGSHRSTCNQDNHLLLFLSKAGNGLTGHWSMGHFFGWVTWVIDQCMLTQDTSSVFSQSDGIVYRTISSHRIFHFTVSTVNSRHFYFCILARIRYFGMLETTVDTLYKSKNESDFATCCSQKLCKLFQSSLRATKTNSWPK